MQLKIVFMNTFFIIIVTSREAFHIVQFGKFGLCWAKKMIIMDDGHDPYDPDPYSMGENIKLENDEIESSGRRNQETPPDIAATMRSLRVELQSCIEDN